MVKFIILSGARTGSTYLVSLLDKMKKVFCAKEIFNENMLNEKKKNSPIESIQRIYQTDNNPVTGTPVKAKGFKIHYEQALEDNLKYVWQYLQNQTDIRVIHLKRKNLLRTVLSLKKAKITDSWSGFSEDDNVKKFSVELNFNRCVDFFIERTNQEKEYNDKFKNHQIITVYYEDLIDNYDDTILEIQKFLGIRIWHRQLLKNKTKTHKNKLYHEIKNYRKLQKRFMGTDWEKFFDE